MNTTDSFKSTIQNALNMRAFSDPLFAETLAKENKTIDGACNYIIEQVKKSKCSGFDDDEIYAMAVHYYDEDDIKSNDTYKGGKGVVVNHLVILTAEDKANAKKKAMEDLIAEERAKLVKKTPGPRTTYNESGKQVEVKKEVEPDKLF
jgi:hypothetical protein